MYRLVTTWDGVIWEYAYDKQEHASSYFLFSVRQYPDKSVIVYDLASGTRLWWHKLSGFVDHLPEELIHNAVSITP